MSDEAVGQGIAERVNNEKVGVFDLTPALCNAPYTIKTRQLPTYPESGQSFDNVAWSSSPAPCPEEPGFWSSLFGPTKADLRREIEALKEERDKNLTTYAGDLFRLRKQVTSIQASIKDSQFSLRQKDEKIATLIKVCMKRQTETTFWSGT